MKKRIISLGLSLAMVLTSANSVFAEKVEINGNPATLPYTSTVSSSTATGSGSLTYLDKDVTIVTLPTSTLDFTMDPQGILGAKKAVAAAKKANSSLDAAAEQSIFTDKLDDNEGKIYGTNPLSIRNEGANQIEVGVSIVASATREDGEKAKTTFLSENSLGKVTDDKIAPSTGTDEVQKANNIALNIAYTAYNADAVASTTDTNKNTTGKVVYLTEAAANHTDYTIEKVMDPHEAAKATIENYASFNDSGSKLTFQFKEDTTYGITSTGTDYKSGINLEAAEVTNYPGSNAPNIKATSVGFMISGKLNKNADWSDYVKPTSGNAKETLSIKAVYDVKKLSAGAVTSGLGTAATLTTISGSSISNASVADLASNIDLTFTPSVMDAGVTLDSSVAPTINGTAITIGRYNTAADYYVFNGNTVTMKPLAFTTVGATGTCTVTVKDNKGNPYTSTITVTPAP